MTLHVYAVATLVAVVLTSTVQDRPVEDIARSVVDPGAYVDVGKGAQLVPMKESLPDGVDYKKSSTPEPLWLRLRGQRAAMRTGPQPTFYLNKIEATRVGKPGAYSFSATLHAAEVQGDQRRVQWGTFAVDRSGRSSAKPGAQSVDVTIEKINDDLFRLKPDAPLPAGEYVILPARARAEVGVFLVVEGRYTAKTPVYEFGVDSQ
jgi:hypothetical protein